MCSSDLGIKAGEPMIKLIEQRAADKVETDSLPQLVSDFDALCRRAMDELAAEIA